MSRYDVEKFDPAPDPDLVCCICQCVLDKAVECPCRHVFCQGCIERWLTNRHTCPTCRKRTTKQDLQPVLPLVQNVLNRLLMICDYRENGCLEKIVLENYETHINVCGYEMKTCRFIKCGQKILKMHLEQHEGVDCVHRESLCGGECGLMIALSDRPTHNCMDALKSHIDEKNRMIDTLKSKLQELNNLSQSLNDQLEQLRQQLDNNNRDLLSFSGSDTDVTDFSDQDTFFEDSNDSFTYQLNDSNGDASAADTAVLNDNNDNDNDNDNGDNDNGGDIDPGNDVFEQVEVTVVNSLFDLSSRLERVRDEMRTVLNTGTVPDNSLTEDLGMRSARFDDIIDNMSRNISDTSARSETNDNRINTSRDSQISTRTSNNNTVDENRNTLQNMSESDDDDDNDDDDNDNANNATPMDYEPRSDHSYSSYRGNWQSPGHDSTYSNRSPQSSHRSPSHSYRSDDDRQSLSDHSYSATPDRRSIRSVRSVYTRSPTPFPDISDGNSSRSRSSASDRQSERSLSSRSPSRSPARSFHSNIFSPNASPDYHSTPRSTHSLDESEQSRRSYRSYRADGSTTPRNSDGTKSADSQSLRSPISRHWSSENDDSDNNEDSDGSRHLIRDWSYSSQRSCNRDFRESRHSGDDWSNRSQCSHDDRFDRSHDWSNKSQHSPDAWSDRSRSSLSHRDEVSDDERRSTADSHVTNMSADSHVTNVSDRNDRSDNSDWHTSREPSPERSRSHYDSEDDRGSRTPTSVYSISNSGADTPTPSRHSDSEKQLYRSSAEESSPRKTTPDRPGTPLRPSYEESAQRQTPSPSLGELYYWGEDDLSYINNLPSDELPSESGSDRSPPRRRLKRRRKRVRNRKQSPAATGSTSRETVQQRPTSKKNEQKLENETSNIVKVEILGKSEGETGARDSVRRTSGASHRAVRSIKTETPANTTPDRGIASAMPDTERNLDENLPKSAERKRKAVAETENSAAFDGIRRSKRNKPATVGLVTQAPIPGQSTILKTSLPQATSTPSNVNLKIDLSLYNISGQLFPSAKAMTVTNAASSSSKTLVTQSNSSQSSAPSPIKNLRNMPKRVPKNVQSTAPSNTKPEPTQTSKTKSQNSATPCSNPQEPASKSKTQTADIAQRRSKRKRVPSSQRSNNTSAGSRDFPNSWCDDTNSESTDNESDKTWSPGPDKSETDESLTEEEEILSDSSYEVLVPKTAADLLNEYKSDDTDESWTIGEEC